MTKGPQMALNLRLKMVTDQIVDIVEQSVQVISPAPQLATLPEENIFPRILLNPILFIIPINQEEMTPPETVLGQIFIIICTYGKFHRLTHPLIFVVIPSR